jgi:hypothetical protein
MDSIHAKLFNSVTEYDRKQSTKKYYNVHALGHYARMLQKIRHLTDKGHDIRSAIVVCSCDRLRDVMLKSIGEKIAGKFEELRYRDAQRDAVAFDYLEDSE